MTASLVVIDCLRAAIMAPRPPLLAHLGLATLTILVLATLRNALFADYAAWFLFTPAVVVIALFLGGNAGLLATLLAALSAGYAASRPDQAGYLPFVQWVAFAMFGVTSAALVGLVVALRSALLGADMSRADLARSVAAGAEREAFLSGVLSSSTDCIKVLDLNGRLTFMSEGGQRVMEVSDFNAIAGCPWPDFWAGGGNAEAVAAVAAAREGQASAFVGKASTMQGTPKWWHVAVSPIRGLAGVPDRLLSVSRDITALRESEEERDRFVRLAENSTDFIGMAHTDGRVFYMNDAARRMVGLEGADITKLTVADFFPPEQVETVTSEVLPAVDRDGHWTGELSFCHFRTGELIPVLYSVFPVTDSAGRTVGYGTVTRDFRARKTAELYHPQLYSVTAVEQDKNGRFIMRITLMSTVVALTLGVATSAFAQGETRNPPSPNAGNSSPTPPNSVPSGSLTVPPSAPGGGSPTIGTQSGTTGMTQPAGPSGSTQNNPSGAFQQTVPKPGQ